MKNIYSLLPLVQEHIAEKYSSLLAEKNRGDELKAYIVKFLRDGDYTVDGIENETLVNKIYSEMVEYSILTEHLKNPELEEINVNAWNDIALTYRDGHIEKQTETFHSPEHAVDIIRRLLSVSDMIIDNAMPMAQGHLPNNIRITAIKEPVVDNNVGISCSIRILHPNKVDKQKLIDTKFATEEMLYFLEMCLRYGISFVIAGATSSGKTTVLNALLHSVPNDMRVFSIESGSKELSLVRKDNETIVNNIVSTETRQSDNPTQDISQEDLVVMSLRYNPDITVVGEMRDSEAYAAIEASLTGHTVVSTVHSGPSDAAHMRMTLLSLKRMSMDIQISLMQTAQAFPIIVYAHKGENNERKIMDITECYISTTGERVYNTLYSFEIEKNEVIDGKTVTKGDFHKPNIMSKSLQNKFTQFGMPHDVLKSFTDRRGEMQCFFK